jgi:hypothetical protein
MRLKFIGAVGALSLLVTAPAFAQTASPLGGSGPAQARSSGRTAPQSTAKPTREPTAGQMAARERQKKCGAEWKEAKTAGKTGGLKWPQYWSKCNARLKGNQA